MCGRCNEAGHFELCGSCRGVAAAAANTGFPFTRQQLSLGALIDFTWLVYKRNFVLVTLMMLVTLVASFLVQGASYGLQIVLIDEPASMIGLSLLGFIVQVAVQAGLMLGVLQISLRLMRGQPAQLGMLLSGVAKLGGLFVQGIVTYLGLSIGAFLAAIPIIGVFYFVTDAPLPTFAAAGLLSLLASVVFLYVALGVSFSALELVAQPQVGPFSAIQNSWRIVNDQRLNVFLAFLALAALAFLGFISCFVGLVFTLGFGVLFFTGLYLALRNGAAVP